MYTNFKSFVMIHSVFHCHSILMIKLYKNLDLYYAVQIMQLESLRKWDRALKRGLLKASDKNKRIMIYYSHLCYAKYNKFVISLIDLAC